jgi:7,8-dihydro-6-hydroxymethylpterin-pyrophosphokinase
MIYKHLKEMQKKELIECIKYIEHELRKSEQRNRQLELDVKLLKKAYKIKDIKEENWIDNYPDV